MNMLRFLSSAVSCRQSAAPWSSKMTASRWWSGPYLWALFAGLTTACWGYAQDLTNDQSIQRLAAQEHPSSPVGRAVSPAKGEVISLFNGQDLTGWTRWIEGVDPTDLGDRFTVQDGSIRIRGDGIGYLATKRRFRDYHLRAEYCWGTRTSGSGSVRNSGVLLHARGPEGNADGKWMASVECQLAQGCEGDVIVIQGVDSQGEPLPVSLTSTVQEGEDGQLRWHPQGERVPYDGHQIWWRDHQVGFEERVDTRGLNDVASPLGEWTLVECICRGNTITIKINGVTVNRCEDVKPSAGKILLESEGDEILFRNIEMHCLASE